MSEPVPPTTPKDSEALGTGLLVLATIACVVIALAVWYGSRQIRDLRADVDQLKANQTQILTALQAKTGKMVASPSAGVGMTLDLTGHQSRGAVDAPVTFVEFSDYECPYCRKYFNETRPQIDKNYVDTGKIRYVFFDFPIDQLHPQSIKAHEAAHCAAEQNRFWQMHDQLFQPPDQHTPAKLDEMASRAGLNMDAFKACVASGKTDAAITKSVDLAAMYGATATPSFFIGTKTDGGDQIKITNGFEGAQPYAQFAHAIDQAIVQAGKK